MCVHVAERKDRLFPSFDIVQFFDGERAEGKSIPPYSICWPAVAFPNSPLGRVSPGFVCCILPLQAKFPLASQDVCGENGKAL